MALFKISKGSKNNLPTTLTEGYCWYTFEDSMFYIDFKDADGVLQRKALNAKEAESLIGCDITPEKIAAWDSSIQTITTEVGIKSTQTGTDVVLGIDDEVEFILNCGTAEGFMEEPAERLEGDGQEFYTMAPSTLSFRSTAPLNELQDVKINGETVDPANYELEEGSTIVKLKYDYLSTLDVGQYELSVVSDSKTVKGDFTVAAPELNEHGFYYNQPYYCQAVIGDPMNEAWINHAIIFLEDGTALAISIEDRYSTAIEMSHEGDSYSLLVGGALCTGKFSADGKTFVGTDVFIEGFGAFLPEYVGPGIDFVINTEVVAADNEYFYISNIYEENTMIVLPKDNTKTSYGVTKNNINNKPVVSFGVYAFQDNVNLKHFIIPNGITDIISGTFANCVSLESVTIPASVTSISSSAFNGCTSLTSITIPANVTSIGDYAFTDCKSLTSVTFAEGSQLTSIGTSAFENCHKLKSFTIPDGVTSIDDDAFSFAPLVEIINKSSLDITEGSNSYGSIALNAIDVHSGESQLVNYADYLFYSYAGVNYLVGYLGSDTQLVLPESYNEQNYEIYQSAFYRCESITSIMIPESVTAISKSAFSHCYSLASITIPNSVTSIGNGAFSHCGLTSIPIADSVTSIESNMFTCCNNFVTITIPNTVTFIGDFAFDYCSNLKSVTIPNSVTSIRSQAFAHCPSLTSIIFSGTMAQWNAITKYNNWNKDVPATYVQCSDGQAAL